MKKEILMIVFVATVVLGVVLWFTNLTKPVTFEVIAQIGIVILLVGFAVYIAVSRIKSAKDGLKPEDELSKKIRQKALATSYLVSLYWWLFLGFYSDKKEFACHTIIGMGILGMAVLFAGFWVYYNYKGNYNE